MAQPRLLREVVETKDSRRQVPQTPISRNTSSHFPCGSYFEHHPSSKYEWAEAEMTGPCHSFIGRNDSMCMTLHNMALKSQHDC